MGIISIKLLQHKMIYNAIFIDHLIYSPNQRIQILSNSIVCSDVRHIRYIFSTPYFQNDVVVGHIVFDEWLFLR